MPMKAIAFVICVALLNSCTVGVLDSHGPATRRADPGKYILEETRNAGSRKLFTPPGAFNCLNSSQAVSKYMRDRFKDPDSQGLIILVLDRKNQVLEHKFADRTDSPEAERVPSIIKSLTVLPGASSFILVQYDPTRTSSPHEPGITLVRETQTLLKTYQVPLLDYVIINRDACFSFADHRLL